MIKFMRWVSLLCCMGLMGFDAYAANPLKRNVEDLIGVNLVVRF